METPVTWTQLIMTVVLVLVTTLAPQLYNFFKARQEALAKEREDKLEEKKVEMSAEDRAWTRVVEEYERQIERANRLEKENEQLRPLALENALVKQDAKQCREDKEDWKAYAERLKTQLTEKNIVPLPFYRLPRNGDAQERLQTISDKMKAIRDVHEVPPRDSTPTLILPKDPKAGE